MMINLVDNLELKLIEIKYVEEARNLILEGLKERFGFLDESLNLDLQEIMKNYIEKGNVFLIGIIEEKVVCTGALTKETEFVGRIERMSVKNIYRGRGYAKLMLATLEDYANQKGFNKIILETNNEWTSAIELYKKNNFTIYEVDHKSTHFFKMI